MATNSNILAWEIPWTEAATVQGVAKSQTEHTHTQAFTDGTLDNLHLQAPACLSHESVLPKAGRVSAASALTV